MAQNNTQHIDRIRITNPRDAHDRIGQICTFMCKGVREYGRIVNVTATSIRIQRMQQTVDGDFIIHPNQKNSVTKNVITFSRKITSVESVESVAASLLRGGIKRKDPNTLSSGWWW